MTIIGLFLFIFCALICKQIFDTFTGREEEIY